MCVLGLFCMCFHFDMCEKSVRMTPKQQRVDFAFILINKEEREMEYIEILTP